MGGQIGLVYVTPNLLEENMLRSAILSLAVIASWKLWIRNLITQWKHGTMCKSPAQDKDRHAGNEALSVSVVNVFHHYLNTIFFSVFPVKLHLFDIFSEQALIVSIGGKRLQISFIYSFLRDQNSQKTSNKQDTVTSGLSFPQS